MLNTIIIDGMSFALPLLIMAIGGIYSEKSGITNLALEGLQGFGAFGGALFAVMAVSFWGMEGKSVYYLSLLLAMVVGMIYSMLHALLCIKFKADQVISGVVINILALALTTFLTKQINKVVFNNPSDKFVLDVSDRITIPYLSQIPIIGGFFSKIYPFEIIIIVIAFIAWYILYKTKYGLHLRACGENPNSADAAGIDVAKTRFIAVMFSGALSGLAGISFAYSISTNFSSALFVGYGYLSIAALIFGNWTIIPTLGACLLFGFAKSAGFQFIQLLKLPSSYSNLIMVLPYLLTLLLLVFFSKSNRAPRALGEIYDKGKR
ncbi:ABC transporter permease [Mediannikoviicoccus vaginalis]|uniref:ABC transporter permease n=1 Tax=Mediannikoviicoccus vaginalis TaxID=2899727 RepID=UPI001F4226E4|nr:ABC transporter permease [Mediannikoviicoccus vaginalis]